VEGGDMSVQADPIDMFDPAGVRQCEPLFTSPRYEPTHEARLPDNDFFFHDPLLLFFFFS
jgi:hypothetical protein